MIQLSCHHKPITLVYLLFMIYALQTFLLNCFHSNSASDNEKYYANFFSNILLSTYPISAKEKLININKADAKTLDGLPGIHSDTAKNILLYRQQNGLFYIKEDILEVKGIRRKTYIKFKQLITVGNVDKQKRKCNLKRWIMKDFIDLGFSPSLSLSLVLYIRKKKTKVKANDLLQVHGFDKNRLKKVKMKLKSI